VVGFTPRPLYSRVIAPVTHWIRGWLGPRVSQDAVNEKITEILSSFACLRLEL